MGIIGLYGPFYITGMTLNKIIWQSCRHINFPWKMGGGTSRVEVLAVNKQWRNCEGLQKLVNVFRIK